jgi:HNH endonuclease
MRSIEALNDEWVTGADQLLCHYCDNIATTWDHIVPTSKGGPDSAGNKVRACQSCNQQKGDRLPMCGCAKCRTALTVHLRGRRPHRPASLDAQIAKALSRGEA